MRTALLYLSATVALFLNLVNAEVHTVTHTRNFASHSYHDIPTLTLNARAGLGTGFAVFGVLFLFALVRIVIEERERHNDMSAKLVAARAKMESLEI